MMRAFVDYRAAWSRLECMMCVSGGYGMWRRDIVIEVGGFSPKFTCEDIEMTFRVHEHMLREKRPYRIISLPNLIAQTEGPSKIPSAREPARALAAGDDGDDLGVPPHVPAADAIARWGCSACRTTRCSSASRRCSRSRRS